MRSVSNVWNGLGTFKRLQLHKLKIDGGSKCSLLCPLLSPKSLPSLSKCTTSPPLQPDDTTTHTHFILPSSTLLCCIAHMFPLYNPLISSDFNFFSMHRSPPYTRSPLCHAILLASQTSPSSLLLSWHPLCCAMNISYSLRVNCHHEWEVLYVRTCNHFILSNIDVLGRVGLYCL